MQLGEEASIIKRGVLGALANKRAAHSRARALASTLRRAAKMAEAFLWLRAKAFCGLLNCLTPSHK
jgi:hypothetical protein